MMNNNRGMMLQTSVAIVMLAIAAPAVAQTKAPAPKAPAPSESPAQSAAPKPPANSGPDMQTTTATYGDWVLRCQQAGAPARRTCEIVQSVVLKGQNTPFAQIAFGKLEANDPLSITIVVPQNVSFPSNPRISTDEQDAQGVDLSWTRCLPSGCFATSVVKDDALKRWRVAAQPGRAVFKNGAGQDVVMPLSFRGLGQAIEGLAKETRAGQ